MKVTSVNDGVVCDDDGFDGIIVDDNFWDGFDDDVGVVGDDNFGGTLDNNIASMLSYSCRTCSSMEIIKACSKVVWQCSLF